MRPTVLKAHTPIGKLEISNYLRMFYVLKRPPQGQTSALKRCARGYVLHRGKTKVGEARNQRLHTSGTRHYARTPTGTGSERWSGEGFPRQTSTCSPYVCTDLETRTLECRRYHTVSMATLRRVDLAELGKLREHLNAAAKCDGMATSCPSYPIKRRLSFGHTAHAEAAQAATRCVLNHQRNYESQQDYFGALTAGRLARFHNRGDGYSTCLRSSLHIPRRYS